MGAKWTPLEHKNTIFIKFRTFAPKTRFGCFWLFWAQKERNIDLGRFLAPKTCPDAYILKGLALGVKMIFVGNLLFGEGIPMIIIFCAQHKNMGNNKKWKKSFPHLSARSVKPFINVTFWAHFSTRIAQTRVFHFWEQKSEKLLLCHFWSTLGAKNAPKRKSEPKSEKSGFGRFGPQKRAQMLII